MPPAPTTQLIRLRHDQLVPAADNVRSDVGDVTELANSIAAAGLLQPLRVSMAEGAKKATIVAGERRHAAIGLLISRGDWKKTQLIDCVYDGAEMPDDARVIAMLVENLQRDDLNPIEEALGYQRLIGEFGFTRDRVRLATGRSKTAVQVRLALLKLAPHVQAAVASRDLPLDLASRLAQLPADVQAKLVDRHGVAGLNTFRIEQAESEVERNALTERFTKACVDRGISPTKSPSWELTKTHAIACTLPLRDLPTALLPEEQEQVMAQLDYQTKTVTVWTPREIETVADDEVVAWRQECDRIRAEHHTALSDWNIRSADHRATFARRAPAKLVHDAALRWMLEDRELSELAANAGFTPGNIVIRDDDHELELIEAWLKQPSNLIATAALVLLDDTWFKHPLLDMCAEYIETEIGPKPPLPELPPKPGTGTVFTDQPNESSIEDDLAELDDDTDEDTDEDTDVEDLTPIDEGI